MFQAGCDGVGLVARVPYWPEEAILLAWPIFVGYDGVLFVSL